MSKLFKAILVSIFLVFASGAQAASLGDSKSFYVDSKYVQGDRTSVYATLKYEGENAYYYVEDNYLSTLSGEEALKLQDRLKDVSGEYDSNIYPTLKDKIGDIQNPGLDNDPKLYVIFLPLKGEAGGYINTGDGFLKTELKSQISNEKEIMYINTKFIDSKDLYVFIAHELQHLITLNEKNIKRNVNDDVWLNELRSEYVPDLLGYDDPYKGSFLGARTGVFLKNAEDSLTEWSNEPEDYASARVFGQYLSDVYGKDIFKKMMESVHEGIGSINDALLALNSKDSFSDVFSNWTVADYLNDRLKYGEKFGYKTEGMDFKVVPSSTYAVNEGEESEVKYLIKDWQGEWIKYTGQAKYLNFNINSDVRENLLVSYIIEKNDGNAVIGNINMFSGRGALSVEGLGYDISDIVLIPVSRTSYYNFSDSEPTRSFTISINTRQENSIIVPVSSYKNIPDGSLVRPAWDYAVYTVGGGYIRHIINEKILSFYDAQNIKILSREEYDPYTISSLIRAENDYKVYYVDDAGVRHWLNMTADDFLKSGRSFAAVFQISENELQLYKKGNDIIK